MPEGGYPAAGAYRPHQSQGRLRFMDWPLIRRVMAVAALLIVCVCGGAALADNKPGLPDVRYVAGEKASVLQIRRRTYVSPKGQTVELVGAIHIAEKEYYAKLNQHLAKFDAVLFECVGSREGIAELQSGKRSPNHEKAGKDDMLATAYGALSSILKMPYQTEAVDYTASNFVHADVTDDELARMFSAKGLDMDKVLFAGASKWGLTYDLYVLKLATLISGRTAIKRMAAQALMGIDVPEKSDPLRDKAFQEILVKERDTHAMAVLNHQLAIGKARLALFYGAEHLPDFAGRLEKRGWRKTSEAWDDAWIIPGGR